MSKKNLLNICKYYKGETNSTHSPSSNNYFFWKVEEMMVKQSLRDYSFSTSVINLLHSNFKDNELPIDRVEEIIIACAFSYYMRTHNYDKSGFLELIAHY